jgi:hypothetical protein
VTSPRKAHSKPADKAHRDCERGHWFRKDHADILLHEMSQARKQGPKALRGFLSSLDEELRKDLKSPPGITGAKTRRASLRK